MEIESRQMGLDAQPHPLAVRRGKYAGGRYIIGSFDGRRVPGRRSERLQFNCGNAYGAAQSYNHIPAADGRRINVGCAFNTRMPGMPFAQMMNFPTELTLRTTEEGPRLFASPIREIETLYASTRRVDNLAVTPEGTVLPGVEGDLFDLSAEFAIGAETEKVGFNIRGVPVTFNAKTNQLTCRDRTAPLRPLAGKIKLRCLVDRTSIEDFRQRWSHLYAHGGKPKGCGSLHCGLRKGCRCQDDGVDREHTEISVGAVMSDEARERIGENGSP